MIWIIVASIAVFFIAKGVLTPKKKMEIPPRPVQTGMSISKDVPVYVEAFGNLAALNNVNISPQVDGKILGAFFNEGDMVKKGDVLFTIDPATYKASVDKAEAALAQDQIDLKLKQDTLERNKKLVKSSLISEQDYEKYSMDAAAAEAKVRLDQAQVEMAKINLDYCTITSPIDGITGKRLVDPGNVVTASAATTLVNVKSINTLYVDFTIPERSLPALREAMKGNTLDVEIVVSGDTKGPYKGKLNFLDNAVDNSTGTILLRATVDNTQHGLWAGQFITVKLILGIEKDAVLVPYEAVWLGQKGYYVFIVDPNNKVEMEMVEKKQRYEDFIAVDGIEKGQKVVTQGQLGLSPGALIVDITEEMKKEAVEMSDSSEDSGSKQ